MSVVEMKQIKDTVSAISTGDAKTLSHDIYVWLDAHYTADAVLTQNWQQMWIYYQLIEFKSYLGTFPNELWTYCIDHPEFALDLCESIKDEDKVNLVLEHLNTLLTHDPVAFKEFYRVAIAFSLVWDQPPPLQIHFQTGTGRIPEDSSTVISRFDFYCSKNKTTALRYDLRKLTVDQLIFIIDSAVALSELEWALKNAKTSRSDFDSLFTRIQYDSKRLDEERYHWDKPNYTLTEIETHGGICVDQAYFACIAGKAMGIPTVFFTGTGQNGGHAWVGFMKSLGKWDMEVGRYQSGRYVTGHALNPQTGKLISDHDLDLLTKGFRQLPMYEKATWNYKAGRLFQSANKSKSLSCAMAAIGIYPRHIESWELKTTLVESDPKALEPHLEKMIQTFQSYQDIKFATQFKLIRLYEKLGQKDKVKMLSGSMIRRSEDRPDLGLQIVRLNIINALQEGQDQKALNELKGAARRFPLESGLMVNLLEDFVVVCAESGKLDLAEKGISYTKETITRNSLVDRQLEGIEEKWRSLRGSNPQPLP